MIALLGAWRLGPLSMQWWYGGTHSRSMLEPQLMGCVQLDTGLLQKWKYLKTNKYAARLTIVHEPPSGLIL